jgi:prepilin-type N-terminal cleavage/methylation domain-containing protein
MRTNTVKLRAFTLIELLIVVAIIAILAAIAVPNFLEAQVRSKIARVKADERSAATALEAYCVDYNTYPDVVVPPVAGWNNYNCLYIQYATQLSTPVAYITSVDLKDPFSILQPTAFSNTGSAPDWRQTLCYFDFAGWWALEDANSWFPAPYQRFYPRRAYGIFSNGPSHLWVNCEYVPYVYETGLGWFGWADPPGGRLDVWCNAIYDASNGTKSYGGIARYGGDTRVPQQF